jgi:hypothetical protein
MTDILSQLQRLEVKRKQVGDSWEPLAVALSAKSRQETTLQERISQQVS